MSDTNLTPAPIDWMALLPIIGVTATGVIAMIIEMIRPRQTNNAIVWCCLIGLGVSAYFVLANWSRPAEETFGGLFMNDRFGQVTQLLLIGVAFITVLFSEGYLREKRVPFGEYYPLVLWSTVGGMIMVATRDLLILFLGLEVLSIALYVLAGLKSGEKRSQEAALKYFLLGAFASGFMLYGIALIYGATGTTHVTGIGELYALRETLVDRYPFNVLYAGIGMVTVGFAFKAALVPFHMWTPDVYHGAPTSVTGFMAAGSKIAAFAALIRFLDGAMDLSSVWLPVLTVLAVLTMFLGNLVALVQRDAKRILAYSSIAHAGYLLVAVIAYSKAQGMFDVEIGYGTVIYYLLAYGAMTLGSFAVLSLTARGGREGTLLEDFHGLWRRAPFPAAMMLIFMASLAGVPLTGGFVGKLLIFKDAIAVDMLWLALVLAVNSVISVFYYLRIVLAIVVREPDLHPTRFAAVNPGLFAACGICGFLLIWIAVAVDPFMKWISPPEQHAIELRESPPESSVE
ncbi:MAG: NADH-quinone oxidoreductase subunit N [Armatimonadetes bacterium]|nr:NADH-quinone oxidoreductase subunit N [Armatimonadota bacterium]